MSRAIDQTRHHLAVALGVPAVVDSLFSEIESSQLLRKRVSAADINAGVELLPAIPGKRYRLHDASMIAIGGAASAVTSVDINATQAAAPVALLVAKAAGLTRSALLRAGATNATILADGASFEACDANTPVTIKKTGSDLATATHIDVLLAYSVE